MIASPLGVFILTLLAATVTKADRWDAGWTLLQAGNHDDGAKAAVGYNLVQSN